METNSMTKSIYDKVVTYKITAECREPMHVGSGEGERGGILIHPVENRPFLQATGIAGPLRDYFSYDKQLQNDLFGSSEMNGGEDKDSKVYVSDGIFDQSEIYVELRPRVKIDRVSGSCQSAELKGKAAKSGQKFEMESVSAGSCFTFSLYLYEKSEELEKKLEEALAALHQGKIQLGGQKSNGCGYVKLISVKRAVYELTKAEDRKAWLSENKKPEEIVSVLQELMPDHDDRIQYILKASSKGSILVKAISVLDNRDGAPDAVNISNYRKEYILPGTSVKGVVRSQIEKIIAYQKKSDETIDMLFGNTSDNDQSGKVGMVRFYDTVIGTQQNCEKLQHRIHLDKFTGGVMYGGLFTEETVKGKDMEIRVDLTEQNLAMAGVLLMALRDLGLGLISVGSGSSVGRGFLEGSELQIRSQKQILAEIDLKKGEVRDGETWIGACMKALKEYKAEGGNRS